MELLFSSSTQSSSSSSSSSSLPLNSKKEQSIPIEETKLNEYQLYALFLAHQGQNLFITGESGTGKTFLVPFLCNAITERGQKVCATSTISTTALQFGTTNIYKLCGFDLNADWSQIEKIANKTSVKNFWQSYDALIIDDVNQLLPDHFCKLMHVIGTVTKNRKKDNGFQWILIGDMLSKPPANFVNNKQLAAVIAATAAVDAFNTAPVTITEPPVYCWQINDFFDNSSLYVTYVLMKQNMRINVDISSGRRWLDILNYMRIDRANIMLGTDELKKQTLLNYDSSSDSQQQPQQLQHQLPWTNLMVKNQDVTDHNTAMMNKLKTESLTFHAQKGMIVGDRICPSTIPLSTKSYQKEIDDMISKSGVAEPIQNQMWTYLQKYCPAPERLELKIGAFVLLMLDINKNLGLICGAQGIVIGFKSITLSSSSSSHHHKSFYPIVKFDKCQIVVKSYMWTLVNTNNNIRANINTKFYYAQIPLVLGWAHNLFVRNMTFARVKINMRQLYDDGGAYEVFSKVTSLEGISIENFSISNIRTHQGTVGFYNSFDKICDVEFNTWKQQNQELLTVGLPSFAHARKTTSTSLSNSNMVSQSRNKPSNQQSNQVPFQLQFPQQQQQQQQQQYSQPQFPQQQQQQQYPQYQNTQSPFQQFHSSVPFSSSSSSTSFNYPMAPQQQYHHQQQQQQQPHQQHQYQQQQQQQNIIVHSGSGMQINNNNPTPPF